MTRRIVVLLVGLLVVVAVVGVTSAAARTVGGIICEDEECNPPPPPPPPGSGGGGGSGGTTSGGSNCDGSGGVYLYEHAQYGGRCSPFTGDSEWPDWYVGNDTVSSVRIVGAYVVAMFQHAWYGGASTTLTSDSAWPNDWAVGNDAVSSVRVEAIDPTLSCEATGSCAGPDAEATSWDANGQTDTLGRTLSSSGLDFFPYSVSSCPASVEKVIDPVTVVFYGNGTASRALSLVRSYLGWGVRPTPKQFFESWGQCGKTYDEAASGTMARYHIRVRRTARTTSTWGITSLGTPHHEDFIFPYGPAGCFHAVDKGGLYQGQGLTSGFTLGRQVIGDEFARRGHSTSLRPYGNTIETRQCDGDYAGSDGRIAFIRI